MATCIICGTTLQGRQRKFCSLHCKNADTNNRHQNYVAQQARGVRRKKELVTRLGGACRICGYRKNYAALEFHHRDPKQKRFTLDLRALSNRNWSAILTESEKCDLLCANCHAETHHPDAFTAEET